MVEFERRVLKTDRIDLVANTGKQVEVTLPRDKFIKAIILHQFGDYDAGTSPEPDAGDTRATVPSVVGDLNLVRDGGQHLISADWDLLAKMDYAEKAGMPMYQVPGAIDVAEQIWHSSLYLDFAIDPNNPEESILQDEHGELMTMMLPAMNYSSLKLTVDVDASLSATALAGLFGTAPTIANATAYMDVTLVEAFLDSSDPELTEEDVFELRQTTITDVYGDNAIDEHPINLTVGVLYRRFAIQALSAAATPASFTYSAGVIAGTGTLKEYWVKQTSPVRWEIMHEMFDTSQQEDMQEYGLAASMEPRDDLIGTGSANLTDFMGIAKGFTIVDFDNGRTLNGAKDFTDLKSGDIQAIFKTVGGGAGNQIELLEQYVV